MRTLRTLHCNSLVYVLVTALLFVVFQNLLFLHKTWSLINFGRAHDVLFAMTVPLVLFLALNIIFSVLALPYIRKPLIIALLLCGAGVNYFMFSYGVVIDSNMMQNTFETTPQEAGALLTPELLLWLLGAGVLPALLISLIKVRNRRPWWYMLGLRAANILASVVIILLIAAFFYKDYASLIRNNRSIVKMLTPSNYVSGTISFAHHRYFDENLPLVRIGTDAHKGPVILAQPKKTLVVLVVGETARAENFSLGGYDKLTNPRLAKQGVSYFRHASSCGTETAVSVPCMFSTMPREHYDATLASHQEGLMDVFKHAGVNVLWRENDSGCKGVCDRVPHQDVTQLKLAEWCKGDLCRDGALLAGLDNYINGLKDDSVIVLHQIGSHGPAYYQRYPAEFRVFTPTCDSNQIQNCDHERLVNTYNNTLLYTDAMLDDTINALKQHSDRFNTVMVYLSDHGESLGENGMYLHGTPYLFAPSQQTHIPFLIWMSPQYEKSYGIDRQCLNTLAANEAVSQDNLFSLMLGLMNIRTQAYQPALDIMQRCRHS
ncbi:MAG: phosphoethanolamine transferase EptA [Yersiniaceae bacterium]|uniref:Phosphoethanolamine transferase EptA n=1 Tax=Chimaeribacter coloradensis TaxID=2060068 RepID=A0A2N5EDF7_9GAMM|nr:phosphoethanolamine transferase EptA [Chimaeribacter coloradensis]MDU6412652.1 phosphoethanolamine transferase EptA [Yersiniaceae bacterium]PLR40560.1 phosphoethanolamine transferase EptA [Chimaeribacter coloradensis]